MRGDAGGCWGCGGVPGRARVRAGRWKGEDPPPPHSAAGCALKVAFFSGALSQLRRCGGSKPVALFKCVSIASLVMTSSRSQTVYNTKETRAHTHRELIRKWLWEPKGSSLEYI